MVPNHFTGFTSTACITLYYDQRRKDVKKMNCQRFLSYKVSRPYQNQVLDELQMLSFLDAKYPVLNDFET